MESQDDARVGGGRGKEIRMTRRGVYRRELRSITQGGTIAGMRRERNKEEERKGRMRGGGGNGEKERKRKRRQSRR